MSTDANSIKAGQVMEMTGLHLGRLRWRVYAGCAPAAWGSALPVWHLKRLVLPGFKRPTIM